MKTIVVLGCIVLGLVACTPGENGQQKSSGAEKSSPAATPEASRKSASQEQGGESTRAATTTAQPSANTGTISGRVTDKNTGEPVSDIYITVGWKTFQYAAITDENGRYTVPNVPAGESAPVLGFHEGQYLYRNSAYHDHLKIMLDPGETYTYNFAVREHDDPGGQPQVSDPSISSKSVAPGETVAFGLTAKGGEGGLSREVFAASPKLGRVVLLKSSGGDRYRAEFAIPDDTPPGKYPFAFFAASNKCYDPEVFPRLTLRVT